MELQLLSSEAQEQLSKLLAEKIEELAKTKLGLLKEQNRRRLMTRAEAARYLHLSGNSFDDFVRPYVKPVNFEGLSRLMWDVEDLDRFIEERKV